MLKVLEMQPPFAWAGEDPHTPTFPSQGTSSNIPPLAWDVSATPLKTRPSASRMSTPGNRGAHPVDKTPAVARMVLEHSNTVPIGRGSFGVVLRGTFDGDNHEYAIKQSSKPIQGEGDRQHRLQEAYAAAVCSNPHLLRYYDCWIEDSQLHMRTEYVPGGNIMHLEKPWTQSNVCLVLQHIAIGLHYLHSSGIAHLDVKPENILVTECEGYGPLYKLGDFGLARRTEALPHGLHFAGENDDEGDHRYLCPHMLASCGGGGQHYAKEADIYSLGASVVELMGGDPSQVRYGVFGPRFDDTHLYPSNALRRLIRHMCNPQPTQRPSAIHVIEEVLGISAAEDPALAAALERHVEPRRRILEQRRRELEALQREMEEIM